MTVALIAALTWSVARGRRTDRLAFSAAVLHLALAVSTLVALGSIRGTGVLLIGGLVCVRAHSASRTA